ncbi:MAG: Dam family site-specific DNA-(adenine-N6)-methyltransferase [Eubacteriales bacterium]|nr:Dam family site-specific DNA-(adenine-N6)-methyltransferase [Eubacteriales bacterium]
MRFIGNKSNLLSNIEAVINENCNGDENVFCDIFSGTSSVSRYFKNRYKVISNDMLYFSYVLQKATIENNKVPNFLRLKSEGIVDIFEYLETFKESSKNSFIADNYAPSENCDRMYLTYENATRIDFIRNKIEEWKENKLINEKEYNYLLACLIEGVPYVSNITGTYGAYLKQWDKRAYKNFEMIRLGIKDNGVQNECYNEDANRLIKNISGDILYIDPPYNSRQYLPNYHLLETIAKYDNPIINGKTGVREYSEEKSKYCLKAEASKQLSELIYNAKFEHIIMSYNQEGILDKKVIEDILKRYGEAETYKLYEIPYKQYQNKLTKRLETHYEYIFYIHKKTKKTYQNYFISLPKYATLKEEGETYSYITHSKRFIKSPLNYIGGKYKLLPQLIKYFPTDIDTFVDLFSGGFNVGINITSNKTICNDINIFIVELYKKLYNSTVDEILEQIDKKIKKYNLNKDNEEGFKRFREEYNKNKNPIDLYTLTCYSFNYQFRFNNNMEYNNPFGRNRSQFSEKMKNNLILFMNKIKSMNIDFISKDFNKIQLDELDSDDFIYCDPPYLITTGSYNDGNRGFKDWKEQQELELYNFLDKANEKNIKFALSNVLEHKGKENTLLKSWSNKYNIIDLQNNYSNSSYNTTKGNSREVLITNY